VRGWEGKNEFGSGNAAFDKLRRGKVGNESGSGTRRRPKRVGLCRGKHAEKMEGGKDKNEFGSGNAECGKVWIEGEKLRS
jgi:hypothetical protein